MHVYRKLLVALAALCLWSASSVAAAAASYEVSATISHAGKSFASPSATVLADQPATIQVSGKDGYKLTLIVTDMTADEIKVVATLDSSHGSMAPTVVVRPDQAAAVSVGDLGLKLTVRRSGG